MLDILVNSTNRSLGLASLRTPSIYVFTIQFNLQNLLGDTKDLHFNEIEMSFQSINSSLQEHGPYNLPVPSIAATKGET